MSRDLRFSGACLPLSASLGSISFGHRIQKIIKIMKVNLMMKGTKGFL